VPTVLQSRSAEGARPAAGPAERFLRLAAVAFAAAVAIHGLDHLRRGLADQSTSVIAAGTIQGFLGALTVGLVWLRHPWAPAAAIVVGFASAALFAAAHLLPTWHGLSDSYLTPMAGAGVTWFSWVTAVLEIGADVLFGCAGVNVLLQARRTARLA
jgi:hypothetical protein